MMASVWNNGDVYWSNTSSATTAMPFMPFVVEPILQEACDRHESATENLPEKEPEQEKPEPPEESPASPTPEPQRQPRETWRLSPRQRGPPAYSSIFWFQHSVVIITLSP